MNAGYRMHRYLAKRSILIQVPVLLLAGFGVTVATAPILLCFEYNLNSFLLRPEEVELKYIIFVVAIAPLLETLVNQYLVYEWLYQKSFFKRKRWIIILISGLSFGLLHYYSGSYMIWAFFFGLYLCYCYDFFRQANKTAFWCTFLLHSLRNLTAIVFTITFS